MLSQQCVHKGSQTEVGYPHRSNTVWVTKLGGLPLQNQRVHSQLEHISFWDTDHDQLVAAFTCSVYTGWQKTYCIARSKTRESLRLRSESIVSEKHDELLDQNIKNKSTANGCVIHWEFGPAGSVNLVTKIMNNSIS